MPAGASWQKSLLPVTESRFPKEYSTCDVTVGGEERSAVAQFQPDIYEWTGKGEDGGWTGDGRKAVGGGGGRGRGGGGLSPYFNSSLIRVLAAKHLPCSSPTHIHIICFIHEAFTH